MKGTYTLKADRHDAMLLKMIAENVAGITPRGVTNGALISAISAEFSVKLGKKLAEHQPEVKLKLSPSMAMGVHQALELYERFVDIDTSVRITITKLRSSIHQFYA